MKNKHLIFDFETFGTDMISGFPVIDIAYYVFDANRFTENPYTFEELISKIQYGKFDVLAYKEKYGYKPEEDTINWWKNQAPNVRNRIKPKSDDIDDTVFADQFLNYVNDNKPEYWWSRGNTFDPIIIYRIFKDLNRSHEFNKICPHWAVRDVRTYIDAKFDFSVKNGFVLPEWEEKFEAHNSVHDVAVDILRFQTIIRAENDMET